MKRGRVLAFIYQASQTFAIDPSLQRRQYSDGQNKTTDGSFLPKQLRGVHRQSAAGGDPGGYHTYQHHGHYRAG